MKCIITATRDIHPRLKKTLIEATGAKLILTETSEQRWDTVREYALEHNWLAATNFTIPPVGSHIIGVQGYKEIAYELFSQFQHKLPDVIFVPVSRGDLLWGIYEGFLDLLTEGKIAKVPKLLAVEPINRLVNVLSGSDYSGTFNGAYNHAPSIGGDSVTYQSVRAVSDSKGGAVTVTPKDVLEMKDTLAKSGLLLESAAVAGFAAIPHAKSKGFIDHNSTVLVIGTSSFFYEM